MLHKPMAMQHPGQHGVHTINQGRADVLLLFGVSSAQQAFKCLSK
ncbi:MAG: hypothetical protein ACPGC9_02400 [Cytophagales bacterium]